MDQASTAGAACPEPPGAEINVDGCPECGCALIDGVACECAVANPRAHRLPLGLAEVVNGDLVVLQATAIARLQVRGEVIA